jgi:probable HAF family extracellular repeat protein
LGFPFTGAALDINDAGVVVGGSAGRAVLWRDGLIQDLGVLPGQFFSGARGINNAGAVVGGSGQDAFLWTAESGMISLGSLAGAQTIALDINDHGWVIGSAPGPGGEFLKGTPFLWRPGIGMTALASLVDLTETGFADVADVSDINALGQIVGSALHSDGQTHGYLLTPVPEPTTWLVIAVGLFCVAFRLRGRRELRAPVGA